MTVRVAAVCQWGVGSIIVGAADRMRTFGDIEYEPHQTKVFAFRNQVIALTSGDAANQRVICDRVLRRVNTMIVAPTVATVADIYAQEFAAFRRERNERTFLTPLGINNFQLLSEAQGISPDLASQLIRTMQITNLGDEVIITGFDDLEGRGHVYIVCDPGVAVCMDSAGWAAVGSGRWHSESELTGQGYTEYTPFDEALLLVYEAKRRADVAPGVGEHTDLFFIANNGFVFLNPGTPLRG